MTVADREFVVAAEDDGRRLDAFLAAHLDVPRSRAAALVDDGLVLLAGRPVRKARIVHAGETVAVTAPSTPESPAPPPPPIVFSDTHLLVVDKPAGLVVHPGAGHRKDTLVDALLAAGHTLAPGRAPDRPGIVHRLDRDTSGLLVVARTTQAYDGLVAALADRRVERRYLALVHGEPTRARGRVEGPIGRDPTHRERFAVVAEGREAVTRYRVVDRGRGEVAVSLLACRLETGRTHQIRVHLSTMGNPVVGDALYGASGTLAERLGLGRQALHAAGLSLEHPVSGEPLTFDRPPPEDFARALARAEVALAWPLPVEAWPRD